VEQGISSQVMTNLTEMATMVEDVFWIVATTTVLGMLLEIVQ